jgi:hypothetical protein
MRYSTAYAVTPHDSNPSIRVGDVTDALWIGGAGTGALRVTMSDDKVVDFAGVPVGRFEIAVKKVHASGTGVTAIVAMKY